MILCVYDGVRYTACFELLSTVMLKYKSFFEYYSQNVCDMRHSAMLFVFLLCDYWVYVYTGDGHIRVYTCIYFKL